MRVHRIYHSVPLKIGATFDLNKDKSHYLIRVLRINTRSTIEFFDGSNQVFNAVPILINNKTVKVKVTSAHIKNRESPLNLHLGQVMTRRNKMEFIIQKSVELGVNIITPLISTRCNIQLIGKRLEQKLQHWREVAISSCEQCGRNRLVKIRPVMTLKSWCSEQYKGLKITLHPQAENKINMLPLITNSIRLLIGSEGGFSTEEIILTNNYGFINILLGPRILRTETAALTAITALQVRFGDLG